MMSIHVTTSYPATSPGWHSECRPHEYPVLHWSRTWGTGHPARRLPQILSWTSANRSPNRSGQCALLSSVDFVEE